MKPPSQHVIAWRLVSQNTSGVRVPVGTTVLTAPPCRGQTHQRTIYGAVRELRF